MQMAPSLPYFHEEDDMKRLIVVALLGGLSQAVPAQTEADSSVRIHGYQIELPAHPYKLYTGDFDTYQGAYDLSNGGTLVLRKVGRRIYAAVGDGPRKELVAAAPNVFVALDRQLKVTLNKEGDDFSGELLMVAPGASAQASTVQAISLVASR
jgi:hypothetical protein